MSFNCLIIQIPYIHAVWMSYPFTEKLAYDVIQQDIWIEQSLNRRGTLNRYSNEIQLTDTKKLTKKLTFSSPIIRMLRRRQNECRQLLYQIQTEE